MPLQETSGTASYDAFGGGIVAEPNYIESCFSTYLYTGNGSTQTITNGIDLSGKGGLVWAKKRSSATAGDHLLVDTVRGYSSYLFSNLTNAADPDTNRLTSFNSNGFSLGSSARINESASTFVSWTFRKQPKFFDVVTYTGNGSTQNISHNLGSTPGCIIVKKVSNVDGWAVWHRSFAANEYIILNTTAAKQSSNFIWNNTAPTSTQFSVGNSGYVNDASTTYVAYLFAHDAGGFGLTGTDNVISCGSFTTDGSGNASVTLDYEPQLVLLKSSSTTGSWNMLDNMRGFVVGGDDALLQANSSGSEVATEIGSPNATGFTGTNLGTSRTYIYIAIRRGPMKTPTSGTSVFTPFYFAGDSSTSRQLSAGAPTDLFYGFRTIGDGAAFVDRLRGKDVTLLPAYTQADTTYNLYCRFDSNSGPIIGYDAAAGININSSAYNYRAGAFRRAPGFFDEVCYTGTGANQVVTHNLGVTPELIFIKARTDTTAWNVYASAVGSGKRLFLNTTDAVNTLDGYAALSPTTFTTGVSAQVCGAGNNYVAYLFASVAGVSKVGSYTGTGATQTISCGFAVRFVMIKRTDSTGDWWVWDTARGMVSGTDQRFAFNSASGEVNANWVYTNASGFQIVTTDATVNASGGSYIFLAIA